MPPRKGPRNVVKSGNAGNSSKPSALPAKTAAAPDDAPPRPKPLFPVGYKSPVTLLNERCQREGWERPVIEAVRPAYSSVCIFRPLMWRTGTE